MSVVKRVGIFSVGKVTGVLYAIVGLIAGGLISLFSMLGAAANAASGSAEGMVGAIFGVGAVILIPLLYGAFGFIGGIIMAALYNMIASMIGGIEIDIASG